MTKKKTEKQKVLKDKDGVSQAIPVDAKAQPGATENKLDTSPVNNPVNSPQSKPMEYYTTSKRKVTDFFIGFIGIPAGLLLIFAGLSFLLNAIIQNLNDQNASYSGAWAGSIILLLTVILLVLYILAIIYAFKKNRRYIAIGLLSAFVIPFLIAGACFIVVLSGGGIT
jgi:hypothetical protein